MFVEKILLSYLQVLVQVVRITIIWICRRRRRKNISFVRVGFGHLVFYLEMMVMRASLSCIYTRVCAPYLFLHFVGKHDDKKLNDAVR